MFPDTVTAELLPDVIDGHVAAILSTKPGEVLLAGEFTGVSNMPPELGGHVHCLQRARLASTDGLIAAGLGGIFFRALTGDAWSRVGGTDRLFTNVYSVAHYLDGFFVASSTADGRVRISGLNESAGRLEPFGTSFGGNGARLFVFEHRGRSVLCGLLIDSAGRQGLFRFSFTGGTDWERLGADEVLDVAPLEGNLLVVLRKQGSVELALIDPLASHQVPEPSRIVLPTPLSVEEALRPTGSANLVHGGKASEESSALTTLFAALPKDWTAKDATTFHLSAIGRFTLIGFPAAVGGQSGISFGGGAVEAPKDRYGGLLMSGSHVMSKILFPGSVLAPTAWCSNGNEVLVACGTEGAVVNGRFRATKTRLARVGFDLSR